MSVKIKKIKDNQYIVWCDEQDIGTITTYHNEFHNKYLYLKFNLAKYPTYFPFNEIKQIEDQSLQVMTDSTNTDLIHLLLQNGFKCKRHCYTPEVTNKDLKYSLILIILSIPSIQIVKITLRYVICCINTIKKCIKLYLL